MLEFEYCPGDDLLILWIARLGSRERIFNIRYILPQKDDPNKSVWLFIRSSETDNVSEFLLKFLFFLL